MHGWTTFDAARFQLHCSFRRSGPMVSRSRENFRRGPAVRPMSPAELTFAHIRDPAWPVMQPMGVRQCIQPAQFLRRLAGGVSRFRAPAHCPKPRRPCGGPDGASTRRNGGSLDDGGGLFSRDVQTALGASWAATPASAASSAAVCIGLEIYESSPAWKHFSLSPFMAWAVNAMIGMCAPLRDS